MVRSGPKAEAENSNDSRGEKEKAGLALSSSQSWKPAVGRGAEPATQRRLLTVKMLLERKGDIRISVSTTGGAGRFQRPDLISQA